MLRLPSYFSRIKPKVEALAHIKLSSTYNLGSASNKHLSNCGRQLLFPGLQVRFASTASKQTIVESEPMLDSIPEPPPVPETNAIQSAAETFAGEPSFASLGLGSWWPPGIVQNCLEFLHVTCGLPWWGCIICGTLVIRLALFPVVVIGQRNIVRFNNRLPEIQEFQRRCTVAKQKGDNLAVARHSMEMLSYMSENKLNPLKNMIPPLSQAPVFLAVFWGLRRMTNLPVESLKTGGLWWFTDLTVPDQFYILPLVTSATLYATIKLGAEGGQPTQNMMIMKYVLMGMPIIVFPFTINFPGLLVLYWTTTNFITLLQVGALRIPKVRTFFNIEQQIKHNKSEMPIEDKGFIYNVKDSWSNMKITAEHEDRGRVNKISFLNAGKEPITKTYKYDPTKAKPSMNAIQAKKNS